MAITEIFNIAASGMSAQSVRMSTVSSNIANAESVSSSEGGTYRAISPVFKAVSTSKDNFNTQAEFSQGVSVVSMSESQAPLQKKYDPSHPMANDEGYVLYPNVNVVEQMADMISASRSYQMNVSVMDTAKQLMQQTLNIGM